MRQSVLLVALFAVLGIAVASYAVAQEAPGTPGADADLCASPESSPLASPDASPQASPNIDTDASPAAVATEVMEGIAIGVDEVVCGTPIASPGA